MLFFVLAVAACGRATNAEQDGNKEAGQPAERVSKQVKAELIAEHQSIQPGGTTRIGVAFEIEPGWHIYYKEPGDAGLPTKIAWSGPKEITFGPLRWPKAEKFVDPGDIKTFGYKQAVTLASTMTLSRTAAAQRSIPIHAKVSWLACKELCVPGHASLDLSLPVSPQPPTRSTRAELFAQNS